MFCHSHICLVTACSQACCICNKTCIYVTESPHSTTEKDLLAAILQVLVGASLEPFGARRMLPCFDFPNYKANFSISIQAPENLVALSNTAEARAQPGIEPGTVLHTFETTPKMSTYLIGVTVGHMVSTSTISSSGKNVSVWSVPSLTDQHSVALQVALLLPESRPIVPLWLLVLPLF